MSLVNVTLDIDVEDDETLLKELGKNELVIAIYINRWLWRKKDWELKNVVRKVF